MQALAAWVGFPLAFAVLVVGWGFLVELASGRLLAGALVPGAGFAALVVALALPGFAQSTAPAAIWLAIAGALLGWVLHGLGRGPRPGLPRAGGWALATAAGAFLLYLAPTLFSGHPAVGGFIRLDDSATWTALGDFVLRHGYDLSGLPASSHNSALASYLPGHYPVGAFLPLAATSRLVGTDIAWCYASYLACVAALLALALRELVRTAIVHPGARSLAAVVAAGSGLLYGYVGWGGIKEVVAAALVATLAALAPGALQAPAAAARPVQQLRALLPLGISCAAALSALSVGAGAWFVPVLLPAFVVAVRRFGPAFAAACALVIAAVAAAGAPVALGDAQFGKTISTQPTDPGELLGNLIRPLNPLQVLGIWPSGDFRLHPGATGATTVLLLVLGAAALTGVWVAVRSADWPLLSYGIGALVAAGIVCAISDPWIDAKSLAVASPAPVILAFAGIASLERELGRAVPLVLALLVGGGVLWTDARAYHDTTLTPHARHQELADIGSRFRDQRPALMTEYDPWGARWFLRRMEGEGASELRYRVVPLLDGSQTPKTTTADIDAYQLEGLIVYRALVLRRSPLASRPPSPFQLVWTGRYYEVWQRDAPSTVLEHLPLGGTLSAASVPACSDVRRLARLASPGGHLVAARAVTAEVAALDRAPRPATWAAAPGVAGAVLPDGSGTATVSVSVPRGGRYNVWLGGAVKSRTTVTVDGVRVATLRSDLQYGGQWLPAGSTPLRAGQHVVAVHSGGGDLLPGSGSGGGGEPFSIGPVALSPAAPRGSLLSTPPSAAGALCGKALDWIEAVRP